MKTKPSNQSSVESRLFNLRDELSKAEIPSYPHDPYLHIKRWIAKATPIMRVDWANVFNDFSSQIAIGEWTNLGLAAYVGDKPNSPDHQQAWEKDVQEAQEFRQKILHFLDGLLALPSNNKQDAQRKRFRFLKKLYDLTNEDTSVYINPIEFGTELGLADSEIERISEFLDSEDLIDFDIRDFVCITHKGIVEIEQAQSTPNKPTQYFAPIYNMQVENMIGSQIQQGTNHSSQVLTYSNNDIGAIHKLIADLRSHLPELKLSPNIQEEVDADITTLESQTKSPRPKSTIIKECLLSIKTILEGIAGNVIAAMLLQQIGNLLK